jgi:hypothetical protein
MIKIFAPIVNDDLILNHILPSIFIFSCSGHGTAGGIKPTCMLMATGRPQWAMRIDNFRKDERFTLAQEASEHFHGRKTQGH